MPLRLNHLQRAILRDDIYNKANAIVMNSLLNHLTTELCHRCAPKMYEFFSNTIDDAIKYLKSGNFVSDKLHSRHLIILLQVYHSLCETLQGEVDMADDNLKSIERKLTTLARLIHSSFTEKEIQNSKPHAHEQLQLLIDKLKDARKKDTEQAGELNS